MTDEATERQTALPIESELAEAIGALSADAFEGGIAPSPEAGATVTPESRFALLVEKTSYLDDAAAEKLKRAYEYASTAHKGVKRKSGEPYIIHPIEVALILSDLRMDVDTLCAALLHDTIEDTDTTAVALEEQFGAQVSQLVQGVTKITRIEVESLTDEQAATMRKMFVAMSKDIRVIVIKLADRLHNMRTLSALKEDRRIFKSRETLEIYAPIAHRLGIGSIKWELEDLAFYHREPAKFRQISRLVAESRNERETYLASVIETLNTELARVGIADAHIAGRPKHLYSIYQKMTKRGKGFSERPHRGARYRENGGRLLFGFGRRAYAVAPHAGSLQGLYRHAEAQYVSEPAYHGHRSRCSSTRSANSYRRNAPHERIRRRCALAL